MTILQDIYQLKPNNLVTLYTLDLSPCIGRYGATTNDIYRWCDGVNELGNDIEWGGVTYTRYPIQASGFDKQGNGSIPRPKLIAGNYGGIIGNLSRDYNDIVGAKLTRVRTFARYLDASNYYADNYYPKSDDISHSVWEKTNTSVIQSSIGTALPFKVGTKVSLSGNTPSSYNIVSATVLSATTNTITINSAAIGTLVQAGIIKGSGYTTSITTIIGSGSIVTISFDSITVEPPVQQEPICTITENALMGIHAIRSNSAVLAKSGISYCKTIYAHAALRSKLKLTFSGDLFIDKTARIAVYDLINGNVLQNLSSKGVYTSISKIANSNWFRCTLSVTSEITANIQNIDDFTIYNDEDSDYYTGNSTVVALLVSCPQLTSGSIYAKEYKAESNASINTNPYADTNQYLDKEVWNIDRKSNENSAFIEWELTAPYDLIGVKIPRRQCIQNVCPWKYRGPECGYTGTAYFNIKDISETVMSNDICGKRVSSCKLRFPNQALPYGGFPSVGI